ncbi:MAG: hypothetical protein IJN62_04290 [Clostridia bacterium]|nr:hypothetical protein [Clostridia bacterium]
MNFREMADRADIANIHSFITYGAEGFKDLSEKNYAERIKEAQLKISDYLQNSFKNQEQLDEMLELIFSMTEVYEDVYFEAGMLLGAKLGYTLKEKMKELE